MPGAVIALPATGVPEVAMTGLDVPGGSTSDCSISVKAYLAISACVGIAVYCFVDKHPRVSLCPEGMGCSRRASMASLLYDR